MTELASEALGNSLCWSFSEARNLLNFWTAGDEPQVSAAVLLVGPGDPGHLLRTIAEGPTSLNLVVMGLTMDESARHLLLLEIIFREINPDDSSIRAKAEVFLEVFGNVRLTTRAAKWIRNGCKTLLKYLEEEGHMQPKQVLYRMLNLSKWRRKEKESLAEILRRWSSGMTQATSDPWRDRLRRHLGQRYDHRQGVFDWDFHMKLVDHGAKNLQKKEYMDWRETGQAFIFQEEGDGEAEIFNPTIIMKQDSAPPIYHGDLVCSPFLIFGLQSTTVKEEESATQTSRTAVQNLIKIFHGKDLSGCKILLMPRFSPESIVFELSAVYFSMPHAHRMNDCKDLVKYLNSQRRRIYVESPRFLTPLTTSQMKDILRHISAGMKENLQCKLLPAYNPDTTKDNMLVYQ